MTSLELRLSDAAGNGFQAPAIVPVPRKESIPLSFPQQQLWLFAKLHPELPVYNETIAIHGRI